MEPQFLHKLGFDFPDSKANFIFATHETCPAEDLFKALRERHIYVRYFPGGRTGNHLRITVGTREEMEKKKGKSLKIIFRFFRPEKFEKFFFRFF